MNKLIIGGSGFLGSRLIKEIGVEKTKNFDKAKSPLFQEITTLGNILDKEGLSKALKNVDLVVLLAAEHKDDVTPTSKYYDVNVRGTKNVLEAMDRHNVKKIIFTSSVAVYGLNKKNPCEKSKTDPFNHYSKSKLQAEKEIKQWHNKDPENKTAIIIRPTVIFGEGNRGNVYRFLNQIVSKKFIMIGDGKNKKSIAYVGNVAAFIKEIVKNIDLGFQIYNYTDNPDLSINKFVSIVSRKAQISVPKIHTPYIIGLFLGYCFDLVALLTQKELTISSVRVRKFCATTQFNSNKAHKRFNLQTNLEDAINKTIECEFIKKNHSKRDPKEKN